MSILIAAHQVGKLLVGEAHDVAPDVGMAAQPRGHRVGQEYLSIAEDLELPVIVVRQQRNRKE